MSMTPDNIDVNKFSIVNNKLYDKETEQEIATGSFMMCVIINASSNIGESEMVAICRLTGHATENDI